MSRSSLFIATLCLVASVALAEPFTAEHLVRIDRVGAPAVSPDGNSIVYAVRHADIEEDKGRYDLWLSSLDGGEPVRLTTHEANDTSPAWSPNGRYIMFLSSRGESTQVWRIPMTGGDAQPVTDLPLDIGTFRVSPTGTHLVVSMKVHLDCEDPQCTADRELAAEDDPVTAQGYDQLFMRHWDYWLDDKRAQLFALPLDEDGNAGSTVVRLSRLDADGPSRVWGGSEEYAISPDGKTVFLTARFCMRD